jgi:hypothetical protein
MDANSHGKGYVNALSCNSDGIGFLITYFTFIDNVLNRFLIKKAESLRSLPLFKNKKSRSFVIVL